ncbi:hypothetical protein PF011_g317 [Phytophthora fragariae]|uniref:Uncharacterized protein n=1 Tax=Phytophthora fragariae TaxID=53985 RepID=A0A6A3MQL4_9STRA|nr:hypothetical protein PF011_g317 [Phytophthora fragariae]
MCILPVNEGDKSWRLELIGRGLETGFESMGLLYKPLDLSRRSKFIFQLTLWTSRDASVNDAGYRVGFFYRFEKVHSLRLLAWLRGYGSYSPSITPDCNCTPRWFYKLTTSTCTRDIRTDCAVV